jgi:hypothetical protein
MIWVFVALIIVMLLIGLALLLYWNNHPAVQLRRRIRDSVEVGKRADQELGDAYKQAQTAMGEAARKWNNRT